MANGKMPYAKSHSRSKEKLALPKTEDESEFVVPPRFVRRLRAEPRMLVTGATGELYWL
jgi:hypothetical protein